MFTVGNRYNWKGQKEQMIYIGLKHYPGDRRTWYRFSLVEKPVVVWCEILEEDFPCIEETKGGAR